MELPYWILLLFFASFCSLAQSESGEVYYVESSQKNYLQAGALEDSVFTEVDVAASISVLLGVDPPLSLTHASASKLEKLLAPNPFHRPRRVVSLVLEGFDSDYLEQKNITQALGMSSAERRSLNIMSNKKPSKHLSGKHVVLESLNYPVPDTFDLDYLTKELQEQFEISVESVRAAAAEGEAEAEQELVTLSMGGASLQLDLFKRPDYLFAVDLVSLSGGVKRAIAEHEQSAAGEAAGSPELFLGTFSGIKALRQDRGGAGDVARASDFVLAVVSTLFQKLASASDGKLVGVVAFPSSGGHHVVRELVGKHYHSRRSRLLQLEKKPQTVQVLSRRTLLASTSIILIIAALLGTYCLCYMPFTRDSLLYAGPKLD